MRLLFIGDIVGPAGIEIVKKELRELKETHKIDFIIANGENANSHDGITPSEADSLLFAGVDVITTGNHAFRQKSLYAYMDDSPFIVRPANYPSASPGKGQTIIGMPFGSVAVISLMGQFGTDAVDNPFLTADKMLENLKADYVFIDFHAEYTSEKKAFGYYMDGRVHGVFGTHTHVQTADEQFLDKGTAYITDVGMTGSMDSVLGVKKERSITRFLTRTPAPYEKAEQSPAINAIVTDTDNRIIYRINQRKEEKND